MKYEPKLCVMKFKTPELLEHFLQQMGALGWQLASVQPSPFRHKRRLPGDQPDPEENTAGPRLMINFQREILETPVANQEKQDLVSMVEHHAIQNL